MAPVMGADEFRYRVMPHAPFLYCWTVRTPTSGGDITAFLSLYVLQRSALISLVILKLSNFAIFHASSRWYTPAPTTVSVACLGYWATSHDVDIPAILTAALHCAASIKCALLLATNIAGLAPVLPTLEFSEIKHSDLLYQLYNYHAPALDAKDVALQFW
jgi:hypothetical protein